MNLYNENQYYVKFYNERFVRVYAMATPPIVKEKTKNNCETISNSEEASLSRTARNIRELALCNDFKYFATLTINSKYCDRFSLQKSQDELKRLISNYRKKCRYYGGNKLKFLFITEKHKNGAFHFHGLTDFIPEPYTNQNGYVSSHLFDNLGYNSFSAIRDYFRTCNYILKYITKDCVRNEHNQIYISSRGLHKADKVILKQCPFSPQFFKPSYTSDFYKCYDFDMFDCLPSDVFKLYDLLQTSPPINFS